MATDYFKHFPTEILSPIIFRLSLITLLDTRTTNTLQIVFMVIICQIHKLHLRTNNTSQEPLARVSGDDDYYHVINKNAEEAEIACAGNQCV